MRQMGKLILENSGYTVVLASNAREALSLLEERGGEIDLLITDQTMPGMSGTSLLKRVADHYPHIKLVLSSGDFGKLSEKAKKVSPQVSFLAKPYSVKELQAVISYALSGNS